MKNLLFSCAMRYNQEIYDRFIGTLFDSDFKDKLVLFILPDDEDKVKKYKQIYGDNFEYEICYLDKLKLIDGKNIDSQAIKYYKRFNDLFINSYRFLIYENYLKNLNFSEINFIAMYDFRDVLFQKNIFFYPFDKNYSMYLIKFNKKIKNCSWSSKNIRNYNNDFYESIKENTIISAASIFGNIQNNFFQIFKNYCKLLKKFSNIDDQTLLNVFNYKNKLNTKLYYSNLLTNNIDKTTKFYTLDNKFTNKDGEISYSVHMYDRLKYMKGGMKFLKKLTESSKYNFLCGLSQGRSMDKKKWHYF